MAADTTKFTLSEDAIPTHWVNLLADLPPAPPPLSPATGEPAGPDDLGAIFPMGLILQEVASDPLVEIPDEVRDAYRLWRPAPLFRARPLERGPEPPAPISFKYGGPSPAGPPQPHP